ncbi:DUF938 domain-containing protein [Pseudorhodobacter sp.]|uniref:DUF938 domain-containing protein n=1 Tax=Pseudorhodobacter sp. TaxID=1934400 RepID=UPI002648EA62|nr:DUF938 domain-containing protein [Pseudorhodobacter sp.]MDN5787467.1 class I SAM-dependent methyltransferase [Pseudorhodobacter sp.]
MSRAPDLPEASGLRRSALAAERNLAPILAVLARHAPKSGNALEIASGTGQQITAFAAAHPGLIWQGSDFDPANLQTIEAWAAYAPAPNLLPPVRLDAAQTGWSRDHARLSLILTVNLTHLIPATAVLTLLREAALALRSGGVFMIYGPFLREGRATSAGDLEFDANLRARDPATGYKDIDWIKTQLEAVGFGVVVEDMPANNLMLTARKP